jgi:YVTN family beta-propeller protein
MYVGLENANGLSAIDTQTNQVIATIPIGQAPQAVTYVANAVPAGAGADNLQPLGLAGISARLTLRPRAQAAGRAAPTSIALFDQGLIQVLQASVTGLDAKKPYILALSEQPDGSGRLQPLASFMTNPAGSAIVDATGPIRQIVQDAPAGQRRYLVIASGSPTELGGVVQVQTQ